MLPVWNQIDIRPRVGENGLVPRSRFDELVSLAEGQDGLFTSALARQAGFTASVLARLAQRGRIERTARGVYRIPYVPLDRFSQYREVALWANAHRGPAAVALSHETALGIYGISDADPAFIHLTVPPGPRLRRVHPPGVVIHRAHLLPGDLVPFEGLPVTSVTRTISDLLEAGARLDFIRQAIAEARKEGFLSSHDARQLRRNLPRHVRSFRRP